MHEIEPDEEYEYDEIANVPKHNLRMLSDLYAPSRSQKDTIRFKLDTGTGGNMLPYDTWKEFFPGQSSTALAKTIDRGMTLQAYNKSEIRQLGTCNLKISHNGATHTYHFFIVPSQYCPILGLNDLMALNLVTFNCPTTTSWSSSCTSTSIDTVMCDSVNQTIDIKRPLTLTDIIDNPKYKHLFQGIGKFKIKPVEITLKEGAIPYQSPPRRVPVALQDPFVEELGCMECQGTITKLDKSITPEWLNSFDHSQQGSPNLPLHICLDPTPLNDAIIRPIKHSNTFDEVSHKLANATHYTGFDTTQGFFHIPLSEKSKMLTAMLTPYGTYVFNFLPMGCSCSGDLLKACIHELFSDLIEQGRMTNIADDILCYGANEQEHDINVIKFLDRCVEVDMHLNPRKVKFKSPEVPFYGNMLTKDGIKPDPKKVEALQDWHIPEDRQQLQSFLGSVSYLSHFIAGLSDLRKPLQNLVGADTPFIWTETHTQAFNCLKSKISNDCLIHFYDTKKPVFIECDSSGVGIGAVLLQPDSDHVGSDKSDIPCNLRPVAYASKSLTEAEHRYANIECELLAVLFSVEHFRHFVYARDVTIITDHKPLLAILKKCIHNMAPRLARMMLCLSDYNITMLYKAGRDVPL